MPRLLHTEVREYWDKQVEAEVANNDILRPRWECIDKPQQQKLRLEGDSTIKKLTELLATGFKVTRSQTQWQVHEAMINSLLPMIYGEEWKINQGRILKSLNLEKLEQEVMIVMARREGKSYSVGMGVAALMLLVPNINIAVFATGKRMAQALLDITKNFLDLAWKHSISPKGYTTLHKNAESFILRGPDNTVRTVKVMPGTAKVCVFCIACLVLCVCVCVVAAVRFYSIWARNQERKASFFFSTLFFFSLLVLGTRLCKFDSVRYYSLFSQAY